MATGRCEGTWGRGCRPGDIRFGGVPGEYAVGLNVEGLLEQRRAVLPRAEVVPRTVLEAITSRIQMVVSDLDYVSEVIGDTGEIVDVEDRESVTSSITASFKK